MSADHVFTAQLSGEYIFETSYYNAPKKVGIRIEAYEALSKEYNKLVPLFTEYQDRLIKEGLISIPKTPEDIIQEQAERLKKTDALLEKVSLQLAALTGNSNGPNQHYNENSNRETKIEGPSLGGVQSSLGNAEKSTSPS